MTQSNNIEIFVEHWGTGTWSLEFYLKPNIYLSMKLKEKRLQKIYRPCSFSKKKKDKVQEEEIKKKKGWWIQEKKRKKETMQITKAMLLLLLNHFSRVQLCATPQTAAHQAPPSLGFSRQEYWSGVPLPSPNKSNSLLIMQWYNLMWEMILLKEVL